MKRRLDIAIVVAIVIAWVIGAGIVTRGEPCLFYDTFRDMAYAENILHGRLWDDPALNGHPWWYPPGNPLLFAALGRATGRTMLDLYGSSVLWLNVLVPVLLYLLVRTVWRSRAAGLLAVAFALLGSYWWLTHALAPMPSVQGVAINLAALLLWHHAQERGWPWVVASGVLAGLSVWNHPLCGVVLIGAIGLHGALAALRRDGDRFATLRRAALACAVAAAIAAPALVHVLALPRLNPAPFAWFAPELRDLRHALHAHAPLMLPLGMFGAWHVWRTMPQAWWLIGWLLIGVTGQALGYLGHELELPVPWLLPHEFQWHGQLALAICAAAGALRIAALVAQRVRRVTSRARLQAAAATVVAAATLGPAVPHLEFAGHQLVRLDAGWANTLAVTRWVREHLPIHATVIVQPDAAYYFSGLTGRKVIALPLGHMNPASDPVRRYDDLRALLTTGDPATFAAIARRYDASYFMALPAPEREREAETLYGSWDVLERVAPGSDDILFYRVLAAPQRNR